MKNINIKMILMIFVTTNILCMEEDNKKNKCFEQLQQMRIIENKKFDFANKLCEFWIDPDASFLKNIANNIIENNPTKLDNFLDIFKKLLENEFIKKNYNLNNLYSNYSHTYCCLKDLLLEYANEIIKLKTEKEQEEYIATIEEAYKIELKNINHCLSFLNTVVSLKDREKQQYKGFFKILKNIFKDSRDFFILGCANKLIAMKNKYEQKNTLKILNNKDFSCLKDFFDFIKKFEENVNKQLQKNIINTNNIQFQEIMQKSNDFKQPIFVNKKGKIIAKNYNNLPFVEARLAKNK